MKIRVNGKDHALSFGPQVALSDVLRDHLLLTGTENSRDRQYMTDAETRDRDADVPFLGHHGGKRRTVGVEEWHPHRPQGDRSAEWWNLTAVVWDPASTRYFLSWTVTHRTDATSGNCRPRWSRRSSQDRACTPAGSP